MARLTSPRNPNKVLITAFKRGMASTLALARDRATGEARSLYYGEGERIKGMARIWEEATADYSRAIEEGERAYNEALVEAKRAHRETAGQEGHATAVEAAEERLRKILANKPRPDVRHLLEAENNIRRNYYKIMLKTSVKYGNTETKRIRKGEGNQGYLNLLWDYVGSRIRNICKVRYPFPRATKLVLEDGREETGYPALGGHPAYPLIHSGLPELDFGDMMRSHLIELGRQCLKYHVSLKKAKRYVDELVHRLVPFLDYVFTNGRTGRPNFIKEGTAELRTVVDRISVRFGMRNGRPPSITASIAEEVKKEREFVSEDYRHDPSEARVHPEEFDVDANGFLEEQDIAFDDKVKEADVKRLLHTLQRRAEREGIATDSESFGEFERLLKEGLLGIDDAEEILSRAAEESRRVGSSFHRFVSHAFPSPFKFTSVVYHGDEMIYDKSGMLLTSELSIANGRGRADLVLFRRKTLHRADDARSQTIYEPCMVVDLKTKSAYDLGICGVESESEEKENVVSEFLLNRRLMIDDEWSAVLKAMPDKHVKKQVDAYAKGILAEYEQVAQTDLRRPSEIIKAVVVVDSKENWERVRDALLPLILDACKRSVEGELEEEDILQPRENDAYLRMAMLILSEQCQTTDINPVDWIRRLDPFRYRIDDGKQFILYLSVSGRATPLESAAAVAAKFHGLKYLYELAYYKHRDIVWVDLDGEYADSVLREHRLKLRYHNDSVKRFFRKRVEMVDLSSTVMKIVYRGGTIQDLQQKCRDVISNKRRPIIVVSGWDSLWSATPYSSQGLLDNLVFSVISEVPEESIILWFGSPVPLSQSSPLYETRCVAPFYEKTHWQHFVDRIVWNLPLPPYRTGATAPADDHIRVLVVERDNGNQPETELVRIEPLKGWGEAFRSGGGQYWDIQLYQKGHPSSVTSVSKYSEEDITEAMNLLPHLSFQPPEVWSCPIADLEIDSMEETGDPVNPARLPDRIRFSPREYTDRLHSDGRIKRLLPIQDIKRKREYRETSLGVKEPDRVTRPPPEGLLSYKTIEGQRIDPMEIRALRDTIRFLRSRYPGSSSFSNMLGTIEKILKTGNGISSINQLRMVRRVLEDDKLCSKAWKRLKSIRLGSFHSLTYFQREHVKQLVSQYPDLMLITGNHLFLLILAAVHDRVGDLYRRTWELLWDYVFPWHLTGLGMCPTYPDDNPYGRSVLDRRTVLRRLRSRAIAINRLLDNEESPRKIRMGHLIIQPISGQRMPLWLIFQHATGSREMNAALLTPVRIDPTTNPQKVLTSLASGDTHWSESKIDRLSQFARPGEGDTATPIMVAEYRESDVLWILNQKETSWLPVGYIQYTTRKIEDVTLVRTITLRSGYNLEPIPLERVAEQTSKVESIVAIARLIVNKAFLECRNVTCHVSLDRENGKYHLGFSDSRADVQDDELGTLSAKRTSDVIELLRRPDADCEPVVINGEKLIWSRFTGIVYHGDARIIRPWVERKSPLKGSSFELPDSAEQIIHTKRVEVNLEVYHDADVCPLAGLSKKQINDFLIDIEENPNQYAAWADEMIGQPDVFLSESVHRHGICWGVTIRSNEDLPVIFDSLHFTRLGGPELGTLIKTGMLAHKTDSTWVIYEFVVPEVSSLPTEIKESIFLLNAYRDTVPKIMETIQVPRTYRLPREEMWKVHLSWREDEINWGATSQETDTSYSNTSFTIRLYPKKSLGVMLNEILGQITSNIPRKNILGFNDLRKDIISRLSKRGYEPENHFEIYLRKCDEGFEYSIEKVPKSWPSRTRWYTFVIEEEWELEEIQDSLMRELEGHGASDYEIVNQSDFIENLRRILEGLQGHSKQESTDTIQAKAVGPMTLAMKYTNMRNRARTFIQDGKHDEALETIDNIVMLLDGAKSHTEIMRGYLLDIFILKAEILVNRVEEAKPSPGRILSILDRIHEVAMEMPGRLQSARSELGKRLRWALAIRDRLMEK